MIYQQLFEQVKYPAKVKAMLVGAGDFGTAIVSQSTYIERLSFVAIADLDLERAYSAFERTGKKREEIYELDAAEKTVEALASGKPIVTTEASWLMDAAIDVVITATRVPEVGAKYAEMAIRHGKHVVFVDKEADTVIAPILKKMADDQGVVFTTDDGDEPGLLMGLVGWARTLGMEVLCGGNIDHILYQPDKHRCIKGSEGDGQIINIAPEDEWAMQPIPAGEAQRYAEARARIFAKLYPIKETGDPVSHMAVAVNGTGLVPDLHGVHRPVARFTELAEILAPREDGGILEKRGVIEQPIILHGANEPDGGGGIFITVTHADEYSRHIMCYKGLHHNAKGNCMLIYRPYHLCGAETAMSALCAGLLRTPTGLTSIRPLVDIIARANRDFQAGEVIGVKEGTLAFGFDTDFHTEMAPAHPAGEDKPIPYFMLFGNRFSRNVKKGEWITKNMIVRPENSRLWALRDMQDQEFFGQE